jgi:hypothetical protein
MTTNSIEAINGHCNEAYPRHNPFWSSLTRIANMVDRGIEYFPSSVRHNFNAALRRAAGFVKIVGRNEIERQQAFYCTNAEAATCSCEVISYLSRVFRCFVSSCHMLGSGFEKPRLADSPGLVPSGEACFELVLVSAQRDGEEPSHERKDALMTIAGHAIKHL